MNEDLIQIDQLIKTCKKEINKFVKYRDNWWNPFTYFIFNKSECNYYINSYSNMLELNITTKKLILNKMRENENIWTNNI